MKIFIANLPHKLEEAELKRLLTQFGQVASVKLVTDVETGKRKGFGFVEMPNDAEGDKAIGSLNGHEVGGRALNVNEARPKGAGGGGGREGGACT